MDNQNDKKNDKKTKKGLFIKIYAVIITAVLVALSIFIIYEEFIKEEDAVETISNNNSDEKEYTAKEVANLINSEYEIAYEKAYKEGTLDLLDDIKVKMSSGTNTLSLLRELYPEHIVYSEVGGYVFADILDVPKHSFGKDDFKLSEETGILEYSGGKDIKTYKGIDVSKFQGNIEWDKVKADGVEYVFIRVGLRGYGTGVIVDDEMFEKNIKGATNAGLKVGVYFFSEAITKEEAIEEAEFVLGKIKNYDVTLPVVLDIEEIAGDDARNEALSKEELTDVCLTFMEKIEKEGYKPMVYGNVKCMVSMIDYEKLSKYDFWYAYYNDEIYIPYNVSGWQYSSKGRVNGITGDCDLNIFFKEWD